MAAFASSHGVPMRPMGTSLRISSCMALCCSKDSPSLPRAGVSVGPGLKPLTRMPRAASSAESVRASDRSPALLAA